MARQQLPAGITKVEVTNRRTGKREPRWRVQVNIGKGGDRHQVRRSFTTEKAARDYLNETRGSVAAGTYVRGSNRTVDTAIEDWIASKHRIKATTRRGYKVTLQVVRDQLGTIELQKLTKRDIDDLVTALRAGKVEGRKKFSPRSVNQMLGLLIQVLATEQRQGHVVRNVAELVDKVPADPKKFRTLTEKEILRILDHESRDRHLWTLALYGLRRGEIAGLRWDHVDVDKGTVTIAENRVYAGDGNYVVDTPKSRTSARTLPLPADAIAVLKAAKKAQRRERLAIGESYQGGEYVACDEAGEAYAPGLLTFRWGKMLDELKIERVRLHDARHSCATLMHLKGQPIAVIAAWLGHSSAAFTMSVYAHSQDEALKAAGESFR